MGLLITAGVGLGIIVVAAFGRMMTRKVVWLNEDEQSVSDEWLRVHSYDSGIEH